MLDPVEFGKAMGAIVSNAIAPLQKRIEELEARQPVPGEKGDAGKDAEPLDVEAIIAGVVAKLLASDKLDTLADLAATEAVAKHFEANPVQHGKEGPQGPQGEKGLDGKDGDKGADGIGLAGALVGRDGDLVVTLSNGEVKSLGPVVGKDGDPGRNGKDGADFTTFSLEYDGERTVTIKGDGGEITKRLDLPLDRGYWREGMSLEKSDIVTHDGNAWLALKDTKSKPCIENKDDWRIFARKGRDGKDGRNGIDLTKPVKLDRKDD